MTSLLERLLECVPPSALPAKPRTVDSRLRGVRLPLSRLEAARVASNPGTNPFVEYARAVARRQLEWYQDGDALDAWQNEGGA